MMGLGVLCTLIGQPGIDTTLAGSKLSYQPAQYCYGPSSAVQADMAA